MTATGMFRDSDSDSCDSCRQCPASGDCPDFDKQVDQDEADAMRKILARLAYYPTKNIAGRFELIRCIRDARALLGIAVDQEQDGA